MEELMKMTPKMLSAVFLSIFLCAAAQAQILVNHECRDPGLIPDSWIATTTATIHAAYNHTSHGSQLITGANALEAFPDFGTRYAWSPDGSSGLDLDENYSGNGIPCSVDDLSQGDSIDDNGVTPWVTCTRQFLDNPANSNINVIMWSWCSINGHDAQRYVDNMEILVSEYPSISFVFMTGHAEGEGEDLTENSVHYNNQLIRQHCTTHNRILFDFADIEAWDPADNYYWDQNMYDNLDYDGGNWAQEWITANPNSELALLTTGNGIDNYNGCTGCAHSDSPSEANLNCILKARAMWWLMARISGWSGNAEDIFEDGFETGETTAWSVAIP